MKRARLAALLLAFAGLPAAGAAETVLFVGNSFTAGSGSAVERYRPETVTDLNGSGIGGVPALFAAFARQAGLAYAVHVEAVGGMNLDFHAREKGGLIARAWDHAILQGYSTLDADAPGDPETVIESAAVLAQRLRAANPRVTVRLFATWSRADQTYLADGHWHGRPIEAMALDVRKAYDAAAARTPHIRAVIPVGEAWNRAIAEGVAIANPFADAAGDRVSLWAEDGYHASAAGSYLAALVIFGSVTGRDPQSLGAREAAASHLGIRPAVAVSLQRIASGTLAAEREREREPER